MTRSLETIAREINEDFNAGNWSEKAAYAARPYINAMLELGTLEDRYGNDSARHIVLYFLSNAGTWRGETARRIKKELNAMLKGAS
jgi:hypothetical protein